MRKPILALVVLAFLSGCATTQSTYREPARTSPGTKSIIVDRSFDDTWDMMVNHVSQTFFSIDNFEKDSGLMIVNFSAAPTADYVDCGRLDASWVYNYQDYNFNGNYAEYLGMYMNGMIDGRANIAIQEAADGRTEVQISSKYVLKADNGIWSFSNMTRDPRQIRTVNGVERRTCLATGKFEDELLRVFL